MEKYEFTGDTMIFEGRTLKRIRFLRKVWEIEKGSIGGWIEREDNLSHEGDCCVLENSKVFGHARVEGDSVTGHSCVLKDNVIVKENSFVGGTAVIGADTIISGSAMILDESQVFFYLNSDSGEVNIKGNTMILGNTVIEATGVICDGMLRDRKLVGNLNK